VLAWSLHAASASALMATSEIFFIITDVPMVDSIQKNCVLGASSGRRWLINDLYITLL
jgi:hypothetical protein